MSLFAWLGRLLLFLLVGILGYYLVAFAAGIYLGAKMVEGALTLEDISSGKIKWLIEALAISVGSGLGYLAGFHRHVMRIRRQ